MEGGTLDHSQPVAPGSGKERAAARWGIALDGGFTLVPDPLLRNQAQLGLSAQELNLVLQLLSFWWTSTTWPRPRVSVLAARIGVDERTVQRSLASLRDKGLVKRVPVSTEAGDVLQGFDLSGLVSRLKALAVEGAAMKPEREVTHGTATQAKAVSPY